MKNLDDTFTQLGENDALTHRDMMNGTIITGAVGSGKSSGSGATFLRNYMLHDYGLCCLTVKPEETAEIEAIAEQMDRAGDIVKISPESGFSHDPFLAENLRELGAETQTLVKLYSRLVEIVNGKQTSSDSFWQNSRDTMLSAAIIALKCADMPVSIEQIYKLIITAPTTLQAFHSSEFQESSFCYSVLVKALENTENIDPDTAPIHKRDFDFAWLYWSEDFPKLSEKTRSNIVSTLTSTASQFLTGSLRTVFTENKTRRPCPPEIIRTDRKIVIVDMSVKVYEDVGVMANSLYKLLFQKAMERVPLKVTGSPVALYADECQHFVNDYDNIFLQTSRSSGVSVCFLTQSINNLITKYGENGEAKAYNLLGLIGNKFAHRNASCVKTNQYYADLIGQDWDYQSSSSINMGDDDDRMTSSISEQRRYIVEPIRFTELLNGGALNNLIVEAIVHNGRIWSTGENYLRCYFKQQ